MGEYNMIKLTINNQDIQVEEGTTILEAAQKIGIKIPTFCYNEALTPYGACRLCCVEVTQGKITDIKASCLLKAQQGMIIKTDTKRLIKGRRIMAELLLARCPNSEKIQKIASDLGVTELRLTKKFEDCALCGMCVRICHERMGIGVIGFIYRGSKRKINTPFEEYSDICRTCGACTFICPTDAINLKDFTKNEPLPILDDFNSGLSTRSVIHIQYPQAVPNWPIIESEHCIHLQSDQCGICKDSCVADAIDFKQIEEEKELNIGSIILTPGCDKFDAKIKSEYGYSRFKNVITSIELERILSASGPFQGHVIRPSDKKEPRTIAFIQCIGSRDDMCGNNYCSSVCCTYATKEAIIAKEHLENVHTHIFYIDMRAYGKGFQEYYDKAKNDYGVKYTRCRVSHVEEIENSKNLKIIYETEIGELKKEEFDLVVLSVGLKPSKKDMELAEKFGIKMNKYGFCDTSILSPLETSKEGIFVAGTFQAPKDIPDSVSQACGASAKAGGLLSGERGKLVKIKEYPPEKIVDGEPRIGVFVCHCGINIGGIVDVKSVVEFAKSLPNVIYCEDNLYTCSQDTQEIIKQKIKEYNLNRIVVASCTPTTHEPIFQNTIREAGLNPYLFDLASLREHCSWVHKNEPKKATKKAKQIVAMSVEKVRQNKPVHKTPVDITQICLVIGGGVAGMTAAVDISKQGFEVYLLEKESQLGGNLHRIQYLLTNDNPKEFMKKIIDEVVENKKIKIFRNSKIIDFEGFIGNFKATIQHDGDIKELKVGTVIVALGGEEYKPKEFMYGTDNKIVTQLELEKIIADNKFKAKKIVMIQCVGSRNEEREYCSRLCCSEAIKNALKIKKINPKADIFVLHKDIRTYGFREEFYNMTREKGVFFLKYEDQKDIDVKKNGNELIVSVNDKILKRKLVIKPDLLVLSGATIPTKENEKIAKLLRIPLNKNKFFSEAHIKINPVSFPTDGIFLCGNAHSPKFLDETIAQASAAAGKVCSILSKPSVEVEGIPVLIDLESCMGCGLCEENCPNDAIRVNKKLGKAEITEILCKGCGICVNVCPSGVLYLRQFEGKQIFSMIEVTV